MNAIYKAITLLIAMLGFAPTNAAAFTTTMNLLPTGSSIQVAERPGHWNVFAAYKYVERDAVLDAFTDSDFRLGGTNSKGWFIGGNYGLMQNVWLTGRWLTADVITGPPFGIDVLQIDVNTKF